MEGRHNWWGSTIYRLIEEREPTLNKSSVYMGKKISNTNIKDVRLRNIQSGSRYTSISNP